MQKCSDCINECVVHVHDFHKVNSIRLKNNFLQLIDCNSRLMTNEFKLNKNMVLEVQIYFIKHYY